MKSRIRRLVESRSGRTRAGAAIGLGLAVAVAAAAIAVSTMLTSATHVTPTLVDDNPGCDELGLNELVKVEPVANGTFGAVTLSNVNTTFDWSSTVGIDAVIVKGGPDANVYTYDPPAEALADTGLHAPSDGGGTFFGLSHVSFCVDDEAPTITPAVSAVTEVPDTPTPTATPTATPTKTPTPTGTPANCLDHRGRPLRWCGTATPSVTPTPCPATGCPTATPTRTPDLRR